MRGAMDCGCVVGDMVDDIGSDAVDDIGSDAVDSAVRAIVGDIRATQLGQLLGGETPGDELVVVSSAQ
jgi:hypothetical protein